MYFELKDFLTTGEIDELEKTITSFCNSKKDVRFTYNPRQQDIEINRAYVLDLPYGNVSGCVIDKHQLYYIQSSDFTPVRNIANILMYLYSNIGSTLHLKGLAKVVESRKQPKEKIQIQSVPKYENIAKYEALLYKRLAKLGYVWGTNELAFTKHMRENLSDLDIPKDFTLFLYKEEDTPKYLFSTIKNRSEREMLSELTDMVYNMDKHIFANDKVDICLNEIITILDVKADTALEKYLPFLLDKETN